MSMDQMASSKNSKAGAVAPSSDDGERWEKLPAQFPRITTLKVWVV
jgi:hypothetical protein